MRGNQMDGTPMAAALPASNASTWRRVIFMTRLASKQQFRQGRAGHLNLTKAALLRKFP
jgi:hypothetical protein